MKIAALVCLVSGIVFSALFLLTIFYFLFNFRRRYKDSLLRGTLSFGYIVAFYPIFAFIEFVDYSDSLDRLGLAGIAMALLALVCTVWTIYMFLRLSKNVENR